MAEYIYPQRDLDEPRRLVDLLGGFWAGTYAGTIQARRFASARARLEEQSEQHLAEATAALSRFSVPTLHTDLWYRLTIKESEMNGEDVSLNQYGAGASYGPQPSDGTTYQYGVSHGLGLFVFPLPSDLHEVPAVFNRMSAPSLSWLDGLDYTVDAAGSAIHFRLNPFDDSRVAKRDVYTDGVVTDREAVLWLFRGKRDYRHIWAHYGHVLRLSLDSSDNYRDLVNSIWDGVVEGGHFMSVAETFAAIADCPVVASAEEVVEDIATDSQYLLVITDKQVYRYEPEATAVVSVGDTVRLGDQLVDTVKIYEFNQGVVPDDLLAVTLGQGFLTAGFYDGLSFENKEVPLVVDTTGDYTKVSFEIGGWEADVTKFWDDFHSRGIDAGQTLGGLLDTRTTKVGEPGASNLPATINPLEFLVQNVLRNNVFAVKVRPVRFGPNSLPLHTISHLRRVVPPHTGFLVLVQLDADEDTIIMEGEGAEDLPGYTEELTPYQAGDTFTDSISPDSYVAEEVIMRHVDGVCL